MRCFDTCWCGGKRHNEDGVGGHAKGMELLKKLYSLSSDVACCTTALIHSVENTGIHCIDLRD